VFTDTAFTGNQLAVFVYGDAVPEELHQTLAREIGFSETVFVLADDRIRIYTPATELPFAGHPVLGTAFVLTRARGVHAVELVTGAGPVRVTFDESGRGRMQQPLAKVLSLPYDEEALFAALGVQASVLPVELYDNGPRHTFVVLDSPGAVAALRPDIGRLGTVVPDAGVSCVAGAGTTWKNRMFGPGLGVPEDPATGSAAGPLAVHLCRHGVVPWGTEITITQGVELLRPSTLFAVARGTAARLDAVEVAGDTVVVGRGSFEL
jgi:trans-2,3-dihydro-3-hydroxyanthranilate isomerase